MKRSILIIKSIFLDLWHYWFPPKITIKGCDFTSDREGIKVDLDNESDRVEFIGCKFEDWK